MEGGGVREGGGYGVVVERGKEWGHSHIVASHSLVRACLRTWAVGGHTRGSDRARAGGMVATSPMATWPLQVGVKGRKGGERDDAPTYADGDDACHRHCLDDVARCHVVACTLPHLSCVGVRCCHCGWL